MGKFKELAIEQIEELEQMEEDDFDSIMDEMHTHHVIWSAVELCKREDYGYSKFLDELHKALNEARGQGES
jgi:hypothetical protein